MAVHPLIFLWKKSEVNSFLKPSYQKPNQIFANYSTMEEEVNFPRGRIEKPKKPVTDSNDSKLSATTPTKKRKSRNRSDSGDFLFGTAGGDRETRKKIKSSEKHRNTTRSSSSSGTTTTSSLPIGGGGVLQPTGGSASTKKAAFIESLSFQKIARGTKLLGIVREVATEYVVVSLPSMLTGFIRRHDGIRLDHVLSVGMVLAVEVVRATSESVSAKSSSNSTVKRRIELAISPGKINSGLTANSLYQGMTVRGLIRSVEDHGCIVDLSVAGVAGAGGLLLFVLRGPFSCF